ncbi:hypothetical protein AB0I10_12910 [Streptomyces sp. NPDC050636]|uniref:hypothetical protein n=1 Tax=Streptomyces sp. NPDC050636 TaxID=3154510 RepID=UPI0034173049
MPELTLRIPDAEWGAWRDFADARGLTPDEAVLDAVRQRLRDEAAAVGAVAERLATRHAELLRRLGA